MSAARAHASWELDSRYVAARRVLLDALTALEPHSAAIIVAGAQAIYLRTNESDPALAVAPYTTDGDLALDPVRLEDNPQLEQAMEAAGFRLRVQEGGHVEPGSWIAETQIEGEKIVVPVDLIVPEGVAKVGGSRGARLESHGKRAARRAVGLEAALVDNDELEIAAFEPDDHRIMVVHVAGVAALFVAKLHKLHDHLAQGGTRLDDKDAADVVRLMQSSDPYQVKETWTRLCGDDVAGEVSVAAARHLRDIFGRRGATGIEMASRALRLAMPPERVEAICLAYSAALLNDPELVAS